jgi:mannose/fructose/N-acetylgalactosamine-specific phosphotransferase system component IID
MHIVAIAWVYVVMMMAVAEATNSNGTVLGAIVTFILYGVLPLSILLYIMRSPQRRRVAKAKELAEATELSAEPVSADKPAQEQR